MPVRFQVDPDFYDHPKTYGMSDAAVALWTRAGSYSAAKLTDGFIAEHVLALLSQTPQEAADELRRRGLWSRVKGGYRFSTNDHPRTLATFARKGTRPWIPNWLRHAVYARDGHRCVECGTSKRLSLDHIIHWSKGGPDTYENLRTYCLPCNWARGARA